MLTSLIRPRRLPHFVERMTTAACASTSARLDASIERIVRLTATRTGASAPTDARMCLDERGLSALLDCGTFPAPADEERAMQLAHAVIDQLAQ